MIEINKDCLEGRILTTILREYPITFKELQENSGLENTCLKKPE